MSYIESGPVAELIDRLQRLPTIGRKTAQRLAFYLLKAPASETQELADALLEVRRKIRPCGRCNLLSDEDPCAYCTDPNRDDGLLCIVEEGHDLVAIERTSRFRGRYHILGGAPAWPARAARPRQPCARGNPGDQPNRRGGGHRCLPG